MKTWLGREVEAGKDGAGAGLQWKPRPQRRWSGKRQAWALGPRPPPGAPCLRPQQDRELFPQISILSSLCDLGQGSSPPTSVLLPGQQIQFQLPALVLWPLSEGCLSSSHFPPVTLTLLIPTSGPLHVLFFCLEPSFQIFPWLVPPPPFAQMAPPQGDPPQLLPSKGRPPHSHSLSHYLP